MGSPVPSALTYTIFGCDVVPQHVLEPAFVAHDSPMFRIEYGLAAVLLSLRHPGPLAATYNINGFTARPIEIADALRARVADFEVELREQAPQYLFPLVDDSRFREDTGFVPATDLQGLLAQMLEPAAAGENK